MLHSRKSNNEINLLHERALWMIYNDQISLFQELFDKDISFTVRHFNIQSLAIEMFQVINNIAATIIDDYLPHIIVTTFTQNPSLLFQVCVQSITIKILYSIMVPLSGIKYHVTDKILKFQTYSKANFENGSPKIAPVTSTKDCHQI